MFHYYEFNFLQCHNLTKIANRLVLTFLVVVDIKYIIIYSTEVPSNLLDVALCLAFLNLYIVHQLLMFCKSPQSHTRDIYMDTCRDWTFHCGSFEKNTNDSRNSTHQKHPKPMNTPDLLERKSSGSLYIYICIVYINLSIIRKQICCCAMSRDVSHKSLRCHHNFLHFNFSSSFLQAGCFELGH